MRARDTRIQSLQLLGRGLVIVLACALFSPLDTFTSLAHESRQAAASEPIVISAGGTYTGNWISTSSMPAVLIATSEPVTIVN